MATRGETNAVYAAGLIQGIALVTFPAASTIFTSPSQYGLSSTQYGTMFLPQVVTAVTSSLLAGTLARRFGTKRVFLAGLVADLASMALLIVSSGFTANQPVAYGLLLAATACLGAGFGLTVPAINALTAAFHPGRVDASVLVLNALLGLGTALAPVFVAIFVGLGAGGGCRSCRRRCWRCCWPSACACRCTRAPGGRRAGAAGPRSRGCSGFSLPSRSCTASARR
jgi:MFS family permease